MALTMKMALHNRLMTVIILVKHNGGGSEKRYNIKLQYCKSSSNQQKYLLLIVFIELQLKYSKQNVYNIYFLLKKIKRLIRDFQCRIFPS